MNDLRQLAHEVLTPKQFVAWDYVHVLGFSNRRCARALMLDESTVRRRLERADRTLRHNLNGGYEAEAGGVRVRPRARPGTGVENGGGA